jgi:hypothetical protein
MLDWLFESARFSLAGGALGVAFWLVANGVVAVASAGQALVVFQPQFTADAAPLVVSSALGAGVLGGAAGLWSRWRARHRELKATS